MEASQNYLIFLDKLAHFKIKKAFKRLFAFGNGSSFFHLEATLSLFVTLNYTYLYAWFTNFYCVHGFYFQE